MENVTNLLNIHHSVDLLVRCGNLTYNIVEIKPASGFEVKYLEKSVMFVWVKLLPDWILLDQTVLGENLQ